MRKRQFLQSSAGLAVLGVLGACADNGQGGGGRRNWDYTPSAAQSSQRDPDNNPPGPKGGPGTNWENPPGPKGGKGASPDR